MGFQIRRLVLKEGSVLFCIWIFYKADIVLSRPILSHGESLDSDADCDFDADVIELLLIGPFLRHRTPIAWFDF